MYLYMLCICVRGTRTQPLICVVREVFSRLHFRRRHTFASLWGAWLRFASLWRTNARGDSCVVGVHYSSVWWGVIISFIVEKSWKIAEGLLTEVGKLLLWIKHGSSLSLVNVCDSSRLHQTGLFCSVAVVPQSKSTELLSLAAVVPQSKSTEIWRSSVPFHHDLWYLRHWNQQTELIVSQRSAQKSNLRS